jgi:DNA adenine methylase
MIGPLAYVGGKRRLAPLIAKVLPTHTTYVEPFAGGCQVFFRKQPSRVEVLNDVDDEVFNFLRIVQTHALELTRILRYVVASRRMHATLLRQNPGDLTDIQRAARFLYLQKNSFGGRVTRQNYHVCVAQPSNFNPNSIAAAIDNAARRLRRVQLECESYEKVLSRYDRPSTFFYIDPPYVGLKLYRFNFDEERFEALASQLSGVQGKFLLSINDCSFARQTFRMFKVWSVPVPYTATRKVRTVPELLIANYELPRDSDAVPRRMTAVF